VWRKHCIAGNRANFLLYKTPEAEAKYCVPQLTVTPVCVVRAAITGSAQYTLLLLQSYNMSEGCVDLTSDPELEPSGVVQRRTRDTGESLRILLVHNIESFDKGVSNL